MDLELTGKTAIVTGGSRGIGKAVARQLALEGVDVAIAARDLGRLQAASQELSRETGRKIVPLQAETGDDESVRMMVRGAADALGHLDILVNCAAIPGGGPAPSLQDITANDHFWPDMNVKVMGYLRCAREVAPYMRKKGWGRIINIGGLAARQSGAYVGSMRNSAVAAMTKNLADELGPLGINVTIVHPGMLRTERTHEMLATRAQSLGISVEEAERQMTHGPNANSIRQMIDAREIAYIVAFLASPKSIAINGDAIAAGGGAGRAIYY